jgi:hypothetical protein
MLSPLVFLAVYNDLKNLIVWATNKSRHSIIAILWQSSFLLKNGDFYFPLHNKCLIIYKITFKKYLCIQFFNLSNFKKGREEENHC